MSDWSPREKEEAERQGAVTRDWLWKMASVLLLPLAVAATPLLLTWVQKDRGVDQEIVRAALELLKNDPAQFGESETRLWAIKVIESYSGVPFTAAARRELERSPLPISNSAGNPEPLTRDELSAALETATAAGLDTMLRVAAGEIGVAETPGAGSTARIDAYNAAAGTAFDDDTPWNSQFMAFVAAEAGLEPSRSARSRSWETWGESAEDLIGDPLVPGCVAVFWRVSPTHGSGMVGLYLGLAPNGRLRVLGGNVFGRVDAASMDPDQLITCRVPPDWVGPAQ